MKKIMFNDKYGLTTAVLEGRKTMTRRVITIPEKWHGIEVYGFCYLKGQATLELTDGDDFCIEDPRTGQCAQILPAYKIGEEVAVAQKYKDIPNPFAGRGTTYTDAAGWENKMFVKASDMPHRIRITGIKVERLQDISDADILREGVQDFQTPNVDVYVAGGRGVGELDRERIRYHCRHHQVRHRTGSFRRPHRQSVRQRNMAE